MNLTHDSISLSIGQLQHDRLLVVQAVDGAHEFTLAGVNQTESPLKDVGRG